MSGRHLPLLLAAFLNYAHAQTTVITTTSTTPPDYFQTEPERLPLATATGPRAFLAQTNPAPFASVSYIPPHPLETQEPIVGSPFNGNIFEHMGKLSPYHPGPGFGVNEYSLPEGAEITWLNMLSRHGSRYPTRDIALGPALANASKTATFSGQLEFLNGWVYDQGINILSPWGRQELYDSGVLHSYLYGHLYEKNNGSKLLGRTTTQDRMLKSAENFLAGFFGLGWTDNATLEVILDDVTFNNSLAAYNVCPNNWNFRHLGGVNATAEWIYTYTQDALKRLNELTTGFEWKAVHAHNAQELCAYQTVTLGYSKFCSLFTYQEWLDFEQAEDLAFAGSYGFQAPTGRAVGVGYVEEVLARLEHRYITKAAGSANVTLDSNEETFPLNQALNFDFTHDVVIISVLAAFGLKQFAKPFSNKVYDPDRSFIVSQLTPFGARLDIELIEAPHPVRADRVRGVSQYESGPATTYIHFVLNQRTIPLGKSLPTCGDRADGWCELGAFLHTQKKALEHSQYEYACNGEYDPPAWGEVTDGVPPSPKKKETNAGSAQQVLNGFD